MHYASIIVSSRGASSHAGISCHIEILIISFATYAFIILGIWLVRWAELNYLFRILLLNSFIEIDQFCEVGKDYPLCCWIGSIDDRDTLLLSS